MAYIYQVSFDLPPERQADLVTGSQLERVLGYLRTAQPDEPGFTTARATYSLDLPDRIRVIVESVWDHWEDLENHRKSKLAEDKILKEFSHLSPDQLEIRTYREVD
jgi:hypothetical protein